MMGGIVHVQCPACKGAMGVADIDRVVTCRFCDARSLVEKGFFVPEYRVEAVVDGDEARRALRRALKDPRMSRGLLKGARFESATLHYAPYHKTIARRMGTLQLQEEKRRPGLTGDGTGEGRERISHETRVILSDVSRVEPAVGMSGWELESTAFMDRELEQAMPLIPFGPEDALSGGVVMPPTQRPDRFIEELKRDNRAATVIDLTEYSQVRVKRIYYPIWRLHYEYKGRTYGATVDGVTGEVVAMRAPQDDGSRVKWLIATSMIMALFFGKAMGFLFSWFFVFASNDMGNYEMTWVTVLLLVFMLFAVLLFSLMGWHQFRYPGEVVVKGGEVDIEKLGDNDDGTTSSWLIRLGEAVGKVFEMGAPRG